MQRQDDDTTLAGMPDLAIIVAMTRDRIIGSGGSLPWHLREDLQLFKRLTAGGTLIMGRKTHASIGRPLPGRHNIVLSRSSQKIPGVLQCDNFKSGLRAAAQQGRPIFVIGGAQLYRKALMIATELHVSWVKDDYTGDVYFPEFDLADWCSCEECDYPGFRYVRYHRKVGSQSNCLSVSP